MTWMCVCFLYVSNVVFGYQDRVLWPDFFYRYLDTYGSKEIKKTNKQTTIFGRVDRDPLINMVTLFTITMITSFTYLNYLGW